MNAEPRGRRPGTWLLLAAVAGGSFVALALRQPWARNSDTPWLWVALVATALLGAGGLIRLESWVADAGGVARPMTPASPVRRRVGKLCLGAGFVLTAWIVWRLWPNYHIWNGTVLPWMTALVITAVAGLLLGPLPPSEAQASPVDSGSDTAGPEPFPRWLEVALFLLIGALAVVLRVWRIGSIPAGIYVDETNGALDALHIMDGHRPTPFGTGWYGTPSLYSYYMAALFKLVGVSWLSLKAVSLIPAILTVLAIYPLGRLMFGPLGGLSAMAFLAASRWHMTMSRWGWNETAPPLFQILATFFLLRGLRDRRAADFVFGGLVSGLMMYTYLSSRLALATLGIFAVYFLLIAPDGPWRAWRRHWRGLMLFLAGWFVAVAPIAVTHLTDPFTFSNRVSQISVFNDIRAAGSYRPLWLNVVDALKFFHQTGDFQGKHNLPREPESDPLVGALFVIGLAYGLLRPRDHRRGLLWMWLLFGMAGSIFSNHSESPQSYRALTAAPAVALLAGDVLARFARSGSARRQRALSGGGREILVPTTGIALALAAAGWAVAAGWEADVYFERQAVAPAYRAGFNPIENGVARDVIAALDDDRSVYVSPRFAEFSPLRFLVYGWQERHTGRPSVEDQPYRSFSLGTDLPVPDKGRDALFLFDRSLWPLRDYFLGFYPEAKLEQAYGPDGVPIYVRAFVPAAQLAAAQGLRVGCTTGDGRVAELVAPTVATSGLPPDAVKAEWHGGVEVPTSGQYAFETIAGLAISIDGNPWTKPTFLPRGLHAIDVTLHDPQTHPDWQLRWRRQAEPATPIPARRLYRIRPPQEGLTAFYYKDTTWSGTPLFAQLTPILLLTWTAPEPIPDGPAFSVRFVGSLRIAAAGPYVFRLEADDSARLWIDGRLVAEDAIGGAHDRDQGAVALTEGDHPVRIDYVQLGGGAELRVWWTPPGAKEGLIPPNLLHPASATPLP
jgi:hypothetical protein